MLFPTFTFILGFLPLTVIVYFLLAGKSRMASRFWLILASFVFYSWFNWSYSMILGGSLLMNWFFAQLLYKKQSKLILDEGEKLTVLASTDGENWSEVKDVAFKENGSVQVAIQETCLLAFLIEHGAAVEDGFGGMGISVGDRDVPEEGNQNFTPSVSGKLAPEVVVIEKDGEKYVASILDGNGNASALVPDDAWMIVTPLSERKYNPDVVTYEHLQWAYDTICEAPNIGGLPDADHDSTLGDVIDRMLEEMGKGLSRKDLTVSDLFEISVYGDYQQMLADGNMLEITVDRELDPEDTLIVLCASDIEYWHVVDRENVIIHEDGTVTLRLRHTGAFVFLVERPAEEIDPEAADTVKAP